MVREKSRSVGGNFATTFSPMLFLKKISEEEIELGKSLQGLIEENYHSGNRVSLLIVIKWLSASLLFDYRIKNSPFFSYDLLWLCIGWNYSYPILVFQYLKCMIFIIRTMNCFVECLILFNFSFSQKWVSYGFFPFFFAFTIMGFVLVFHSCLLCVVYWLFVKSEWGKQTRNTTCEFNSVIFCGNVLRK